MKLFLVRHGDSLSSEIDPNQPLSEKGKDETCAVGQILKKGQLEIDEVMHSVKLRAKQTAEILSQSISPDLTLIERNGLKPMDPIEPILEEVYTFDRNVMLVGHLPFMERLASQLLLNEERSGLINICGSCVIALQGEGKHWEIDWIISPKLTLT